MQRIDTYPKKVQRNLQIIEDAFGNMDSHMQPEMKLLVAALRSLGFCVNRAMAGYPDVKWAKSGTPSMYIAPPLKYHILQKYTSLPSDWWYEGTPGYKALRAQVRKANLEAKIELLKLIEEFYRERHSPVNVHLTFDLETGTSDFRLYCRGAKEVALPENRENYSEWLYAAQAEMQAFAEFLCTKVAD
jgi:hypothetical protein